MENYNITAKRVIESKQEKESQKQGSFLVVKIMIRFEEFEKYSHGYVQIYF